jgi:uncharacterized protein YndB with AHSA1/START domain
MFDNLAIIAEPDQPTIIMKRMFAALPPVVFEAWTKPEHVTEWWDPSGAPLAVCEIDLRPDGAFRWVNRGPDGVHHPFTGTYLEITAPKRLKFTVRIAPSGSPSTGTLVFRESGGQTELTLTIECESVEERDALLKMRVDVGTACTLENLAKYVGKIARGITGIKERKP